MRCPVCPLEAVPEGVLQCPQCGADLTTIRRVQELPMALLRQGLRCAEQGRRDQAAGYLQAAAVFPEASEPSRRAIEQLTGAAAVGKRHGPRVLPLAALGCVLLSAVLAGAWWQGGHASLTRAVLPVSEPSSTHGAAPPVVTSPLAAAPSRPEPTMGPLLSTPLLPGFTPQTDELVWYRDGEAIVVTFASQPFARGRTDLRRAAKQALALLAKQLKPYAGGIAVTVATRSTVGPPGHVTADVAGLAMDQALVIVRQMREAAGLPADLFTITSLPSPGRLDTDAATATTEVVIRIAGSAPALLRSPAGHAAGG